MSCINGWNHVCWSILLLGLLNVQCSNNPKNNNSELAEVEDAAPIVIDYKNAKEVDEPLKLSEFCESISYIRLDDSLLIEDVKMVPIHLIDDTFYIDADNIYTFTKEGKAVKALCTKGAGPEDILKYAQSGFSREMREFTFENNACGKFSIFTLDGKFVKNETRWEDSITYKNLEARYKNFEIYDTSCPNSKSQQTRSNSPMGPHLMYVRDLITDSIVYTLDNWADDEKAEYRCFAQGFELSTVNVEDSSFWFKYCAIDTIFATIDFETVKPKYVFDTDGKTMGLRKLAHLKVGDVDENELSSSYIITDFIPLPMNRILYKVGGFSMTSKQIIGISTSDGQANHHTSWLIQNDMDNTLKNIKLGEILTYSRFDYKDNSLYFLVNAVDFFEEGCKPPFEDMDEDSNPVVVKLTLK